MSIALDADMTTRTIKTFEEIIQFNSGLPKDWYIGVTDHPLDELVDHRIILDRDNYFYETFSNALVPVFIKDHFLKSGVDGIRKKFDNKFTSVYLYKKTTHSIP
jgi:hypothetical protein